MTGNNRSANAGRNKATKHSQKPRRNRRSNRSSAKDAPASKAMPNAPKGPQSSFVRQGHDPLLIVNDLSSEMSDAGQVKVLADLPLTTEVLAQAGQLGTAFQRCRCEQMSVTITASGSSLESALLVAAIIPDGDETLPSEPEQVQTFLLARNGTQSMKCWETRTVRGQLDRGLKYTNLQPGQEKRLATFGRFILLGVGKISSSGVSLTVMANWRIKFEQPGLEATAFKDVEEREESHSLSSSDLYLLADSSSSVLQKVQREAGKPLAWVGANDTEFSPNLVKGAIYRLPQTMMGEANKTGEAPRYISHIRVEDDGALSVGAYSPVSQKFTIVSGSDAGADALVLRKGNEVFAEVDAPVSTRTPHFASGARALTLGPARLAKCARGTYRFYKGSEAL